LSFQIPNPVTVYIQADTKLRSRLEAGKQKEQKSLAIATIILVMGLKLSSISGQKTHVFPPFSLGSFDAFVE
jgi:hypothetical protein